MTVIEKYVRIVQQYFPQAYNKENLFDSRCCLPDCTDLIAVFDKDKLKIHYPIGFQINKGAYKDKYPINILPNNVIFTKWKYIKVHLNNDWEQKLILVMKDLSIKYKQVLEKINLEEIKKDF